MSTTTAPLKWSTALKLLAVLRDEKEDETRLLLAIGFYTGLRISDILSLTWEDLADDVLILTEQKTKKERQININPKLRQIIKNSKQIIQPALLTDFVFKGKRGPNANKPLTVVGANNRIKRIFKEYDIVTQNPSSHTLRKTFALRVYEVNHRSEDALILLSELFNHSSIAITRKYIGITQQRIKNVYLSL